jgi:ketosteroid isomerase-like protein
VEAHSLGWAVDKGAKNRESRAMTLPSPSPQQAAAELAIRARRAEFNRALADADFNAIGPLLDKNAVLITGTDSALLSGRKAQLMAWKREFSVPNRSVYTRTPDEIIVSAIEPIAMERGAWVSRSAEGEVEVSGTYSAKWREVAGAWVIIAEIFVSLA